MTEKEFNTLDEARKKVLLFESKKITERKIRFTKFELFNIDNFFIETRTSLLHKFKRKMKTYNPGTLPLTYASLAHNFESGI
jgi:hypothetical protein